MGRLNLLVGAVADPRVSYFTVSGLFEASNQVAKSIAQHIPEAGAREQAAQLPGKTARRTAFRYLRRTARLPLCGIDPFRDFVSILIAHDREESQQSCHRWISAAHLILLCSVSS